MARSLTAFAVAISVILSVSSPASATLPAPRDRPAQAAPPGVSDPGFTAYPIHAFAAGRAGLSPAGSPAAKRAMAGLPGADWAAADRAAAGRTAAGSAGPDRAGRAASWPGFFGPGAPGLGDPYYPSYGNGGYDVHHYDLSVRYQPDTDVLNGHAVITAFAWQNLSRFNLDLVGLTVDAVRVDGRAARFSRSGRELMITPARGLIYGRPFRVDVRYHGVPQTSTLPGMTAKTGFIPTDDGAVVAGQPDVSAFWYPVNDHPLDKATYTFAVTVPEGLKAICNGVPLGNRTVDGWTTWRWAENDPMVSYLATATIGHFRLNVSSHRGRPMVIAVDESLPAGYADDALARTGEITDFLESKFGPYPFSSNGGIAEGAPGLRFALENQTRTVYSRGFFSSGTTNAETTVVAHELAHQWFGDSVSVRNWSDIWLNEGFATYAEWLWSEHLGSTTPQQFFDWYYEQPLTADHWSPAPGNPGSAELFDKSVYIRGGMLLQALRIAVGDASFDRIVRSWYLLNRNGHGSTGEFINLAEATSHRQLDDLFQAWLFNDAKPPYPTPAR